MRRTEISNREEVIKKINNSIIGSKAQRNRKILIDRFVEGYTHREIAEKYELSERQIKKIVHDYSNIMSAILNIQCPKDALK